MCWCWMMIASHRGLLVEMFDAGTHTLVIRGAPSDWLIISSQPWANMSCRFGQRCSAPGSASANGSQINKLRWILCSAHARDAAQIFRGVPHAHPTLFLAILEFVSLRNVLIISPCSQLQDGPRPAVANYVMADSAARQAPRRRVHVPLCFTAIYYIRSDL